MEYPYLYETHLHTKEGSACASNSGEEMAKACKEAGYAGIFITNHAWYGNTSVDRTLPWDQWVDQFCIGYEKAKEWGDKNDLQVFFGYESCYQGTEFLIYGVDGEWLKAHPEIKDASIEEQYELIHLAGGLVVQAHPYRKEDYIPEIRLFPENVDAVEGVNATHSSHLSKSHNVASWDDLAIEYANKHELPMTAGSDIHTTVVFGGGVAFKEKLHSVSDFCERIRKGEDYILTNGDHVYSNKGEKLS